MVTLRPSLVEVALALYVQQIEFIHQALTLEEGEGAIDRYPIDVRVDLGSFAQDLCGVEMLAGIFNDLQDDAPLAGQANPSCHQSGLQSAGS